MQWNQLVLVTGIWRNINDFEDPKISLVMNWCATLFQEVKAIGYYFFKVLLNKETVRSLFCLALKLLNCKSWLPAFTNVQSSAVWYVVSPGEIEAINSTLRLRNFLNIFFSFRLSVLRGHSVFIPATTANDLRLRRIFYPRFYPLHLV